MQSPLIQFDYFISPSLVESPWYITQVPKQKANKERESSSEVETATILFMMVYILNSWRKYDKEKKDEKCVAYIPAGGGSEATEKWIIQVN